MSLGLGAFQVHSGGALLTGGAGAVLPGVKGKHQGQQETKKQLHHLHQLWLQQPIITAAPIAPALFAATVAPFAERCFFGYF